MVEKYSPILLRFAPDLWIERCLNMAEVMIALEENPEERAQWLNFIQFLASECCNCTTDKQWSELLNLMQISRRLNHKTVKFGDLLGNKANIEAQANNIRRFNEVIKRSQVIGTLLEQLDPKFQKIFLLLETDESSDSLSAQIEASQAYLQDKCQPLLVTLRGEIGNQLLADRADKQLWVFKLEQFERIATKIGLFLSSLLEFNRKLLQLKPLIEAKYIQADSGGKPSQKSSSIAASKLSSSLEECKRKFASAQSYKQQLLDGLHRAANSVSSTRKKSSQTSSPRITKEIPLLKLLNEKTKKVAFTSDLFDIQLASKLQDLRDCQTGLDSIMQILRLEFGRFYFLSYQELLEVIAFDTNLLLEKSSSNIDRSCQLITKIFSGSISKLLVDETREHVIGIESPHGEKIRFHQQEQQIVIRKKVNLYSLEIIRVFLETSWKLRRSLRHMIRDSLKKGNEADNIDWSLPVQLFILREQIRFSRMVESSLNIDGNLDKITSFFSDRFKKLRRDANQRRRDLNLNSQPVDHLDHLKLLACISITVQFLSILDQLEKAQVQSTSDWNWQKQLRYELSSSRENEPNENDLVIRVLIANMIFEYKFDYLPLQIIIDQHQIMRYKRLITTEITERCLLSACHSINHLRLGASPYGPAGSGKTETVKALGQLLGCQVIVHNCDESNEGHSLNKLIWGLAQTGLWGCFDEFNRLSVAALSTASASLELVQSSIREGKQSVELPDKTIMPLDRDSAFFITLNPIDKQQRYRGRRKLPSNLRSLFQPISMVRIPIDSIIAESLMILGGYEQTELKSMAMKLNSWLKTMSSRNELNVRRRCEWDLRLVVAILKRFSDSLGTRDKDFDKLGLVMLDSIRNEVKPRFTLAEWSLMETDLIDLLELDRAEISPYHSEEGDIKMRDLKQQLETRTGVLLLGPTKSGKSQTWRKLQDESDSSINWFAINPRAYSKQELLGFAEQDGSRKWVDGLLPTKVRQAQISLAKDRKLGQFWLVLDGPIDPDWIEALNSVLDDNQVLTLGSGERLSFKPTPNKEIKLIIETESIELASPATISRLGMVNYELGHNSIRNGAKNQKLSIIVGSASISEKLRYIQDNLVSPNGLLIEYNCFQSSRSHHLQSLLMSVKDSDWIVINQLGLIEPENEWNIRSFLELLRFALTYEGYYDSTGFQFPFCKLEVKNIIVTLDSIDQIDSRTASLAYKTIELDASNISPDDLAEPRCLALTEIADWFNEIDSSLIMLEDINYNYARRVQIACQLGSQFDVQEFSGSKIAEESLTNLVNLLAGQKKPSGEVPLSTSRMKLFFISDLELGLLRNEIKSELFHQINWLRAFPATGKLIVYCPSHTEGPDYAFLSGITSRIRIRDEPEVLQSPRKILSQSMDLASSELKWLLEKLAAIGDSRRSVEIAQCVLKSYSSLKTRLSCQRSTIASGLARLADFGQLVLKISSKCGSDEEKLKIQQGEMSKLMQTIDEALEDSANRKARVEKLSSMSKTKDSEIKAKRVAVEQELAKMQPLLDNSKREVSQQLRPEALNEIKALRSPPKTIKEVLEVLFIILGVNDSSWQSIKTYLTRNSIRDELSNYDFRRRLNASLLQKVDKAIASRKESFDSQQAARASKALIPIVNWIKISCDYGRAIIKVEPLESELRAMKEEQDELAEAMKSTEVQLAQINAKTEGLNAKLDGLKKENKKAQLEIDSVRSKLKKAEKVYDELGGQIARWKSRVQLLSASLDTGNQVSRLLRLCLFASSLASLQSFSETEAKFLLNLSDLNDSELDQVVEEFQSMLKESETSRLKLGDLRRACEFIMLKLCVESNHLIPFLDIGLEKIHLDDSELSVGMMNLTSFNRVSVISPSPGWIDSLNLASTLGNLVIIKLGSSIEMDLDIINYLCSKQCQEISNSAGRFILIGDLEKHPQICRDGACPIKVMQLSCILQSHLELDQIKSMILNRIIAAKDSKLSETVLKLEEKLSEKQKILENQEQSLIQRLASVNTYQNSDELDFDGGLIKTLADLQQLNEKSKQEVANLELELVKLTTKQASYSKLSAEAATFYIDNLIELGRNDLFSHMSVENYVETLQLDTADQIDYYSILKQVLRPATPKSRREFIDKLESNSSSPLDRAQLDSIVQTKIQLEPAIEDLLREDKSKPVSLMIALHDPLKSSPQIEVDDFFRSNSNLKKLEYMKVYATGEDANNTMLEDHLNELTSTSCLCIANAHLASRWINRRLLELMISKKNSTASDGSPTVLLIAEADNSQLFELSVLNSAKVRFWYDELALKLESRFNIFLRSLRLTSRFKVLFKKEPELVEQLILLHVVCQERTKEDWSRDNQPIGWNNANYKFDYDQLVSAMDLLDRLAGVSQRNDGSLNETLCHYLSSIVYGPRMETLEDELEFDRLAKTFFQTAGAGRVKMSEFNELIMIEETKKISGDFKLEYTKTWRELLGLVQKSD